MYGDVISHVNITSVRVEDGGEFTCTFTNTAGKASHTARLNIYGELDIYEGNIFLPFSSLLSLGNLYPFRLDGLFCVYFSLSLLTFVFINDTNLGIGYLVDKKEMR